MQVSSLNSTILTQGKKFMEAIQPYQSPRQRVWIAIRKNRDEFTIQQVAELGQMKYESTREFISCLAKAGIVEIIREDKIYDHAKSIKKRYYRLIKDHGYTAPPVTKSGKVITQVTGNKAMWNALRITNRSLNAVELVQLASNDELSIKVETAKEYLRALQRAGYLTITQLANNAGGRTKYRLLANMNTGPNPPQIQRAKQVFDPNTNQVMFSERPELEEEFKYGTLLANEEEINDE